MINLKIQLLTILVLYYFKSQTKSMQIYLLRSVAMLM